jgi:bifunctional non-homologous end joining protein LigD
MQTPARWVALRLGTESGIPSPQEARRCALRPRAPRRGPKPAGSPAAPMTRLPLPSPLRPPGMPNAARHPRPAGFIAPSLPTLASEAPDGPQWAHEIKFDGYRFICRRDGERVQVFSRLAKEWTDRVPFIVEALRLLPITSATIDGEAVVCDSQGVTDFAALRSAISRRQGSRGIFLYAFDLLELDGRDLRPNAWTARREALAALLHDAEGGLRLSEHLDGDGAAMLRHACALGIEGIVSKRRDSRYTSGRSRDWKVKNPDAPAVKRIAEIEWS